MFKTAGALSPSLSVIVAVSVTRLSADRLTGSFGSLVGCTTARCWSSVTLPERVHVNP